MEKKIYITPAVDIFQIQVKDGLLLSASDGSNSILGNGGDTDGAVDADTKYSDDWELWDE